MNSHDHSHHHGAPAKTGGCCCGTTKSAKAPAASHDHSHAHHSNKQVSQCHSNTTAAAASSVTAIDPVCGMTVAIASPHSVDYHGQHYVFCCGGCRSKFLADPDKFALTQSKASSHSSSDPARAQEKSVPPGTIYTCPMHPQIRQVGPGHCPICGMALEPETPMGQED